MFATAFLGVLYLLRFATAQSGVDLDKPMLGGGGKRGPGAMLRFGCSQVSQESTKLHAYANNLACH